MRILVAHALFEANGGAEAVAHAFVKQLKRRNLEVGTVDVKGHVGPGGESSTVPMAPFVPRRVGLFNWALVCRNVQKLAGEYDAVIYTYGEGPELPKPTLTFRHAPAVFARNRSLVTSLAGQSGPPYKVRKLYGDVAAKLARLGTPDINSFTVANSHWTAGHIEREAGVHVDKILYPALELDPAGKGPMHSERSMDRLLMLGRIVPNKRIHEVIELVRALRADRARLEIEIIGRANRAYAKKLIRGYSSENWVKFHSDVGNDVRNAIMEQVPVGVHAYRAEHFGIAVAEMIHSGVIPIVYNNGGVCELVSFEDQRFNNDQELSELIESWLAAPPADRDARIEQLRQGQAYVAACDFQNNLASVLDSFFAYCNDWHAYDPAHAKQQIA